MDERKGQEGRSDGLEDALGLKPLSGCEARRPAKTREGELAARAHEDVALLRLPAEALGFDPPGQIEREPREGEPLGELQRGPDLGDGTRVPGWHREDEEPAHLGHGVGEDHLREGRHGAPGELAERRFLRREVLGAPEGHETLHPFAVARHDIIRLARRGDPEGTQCGADRDAGHRCDDGETMTARRAVAVALVGVEEAAGGAGEAVPRRRSRGCPLAREAHAVGFAEEVVIGRGGAALGALLHPRSHLRTMSSAAPGSPCR